MGITNKNKTSNRGEEEEDNKRMHSTAGFGLALLAFFQIALAIMTTAGPSTINRHSQGDIFSHQGFSLFLLHISDIRWYSEDDAARSLHIDVQVPLANAMLRLVYQLLASAIMGAYRPPDLAATVSASAPWTDPSTGKTSSNASAP